MPVASTDHKEADELASSLLSSLIAGKDFSPPVVDLSDTQFDIPVETGNPLYADVTKLTEADLTDRTVNGAGLFDGLMAALDAHLLREYNAGRITGNNYSEAYIQLTQTAMGTAVQYLLGKDQSFYQAQLAQQQARAAEIAVVGQRIELETAKARLQMALIQTETTAVEYANGMMNLSIQDINYTVASAQKAQIEKATEIQDYQLTVTLPQEVLGMQSRIDTETAQQSLLGSQKGRLDYEISDILPSQKGQILAETQLRDYEHDFILPKQVLRLQSEIDTDSSRISLTTAQKDQVLYETSALLPSQKLKIDAEKDVVSYQLTAVLPAQVSGMNEDTRNKTYTIDYLLPAQLESLEEQTEAHRAKTLDTRSDGVTPVTGAIGKQKDLHQQQIDSYQRDAEWKVGKGLLDTWITQKSMDEGLIPPTSISDANINAVLATIRANTGLT